MNAVEKSSLLNLVVNFLLQENYLLSAFELLQELIEDGLQDQAMRLSAFFSDPSKFPPDQISRFNALKNADPQGLLEEKESLEEKLALTEYDLRLAQEDVLKLKADLQKLCESSTDEINRSQTAVPSNAVSSSQVERKKSLPDLGPLKDNERRDLNCAIKEYLLLAGYRLTAMTFYEEVKDQDLDVWRNSPAYVIDALRHYYYQYISSTEATVEDKISFLHEKEALVRESEKLAKDLGSLKKAKELADSQMAALSKSSLSLKKDIDDREKLISDLKKSLEVERKDLNDCRAEITHLKMQIEGSKANGVWNSKESESSISANSASSGEKVQPLHIGTDSKKGEEPTPTTPQVSDLPFENASAEDEVVNIHEDKVVVSEQLGLSPVQSNSEPFTPEAITDIRTSESDRLHDARLSSSNGYPTIAESDNHLKVASEDFPKDEVPTVKIDSVKKDLEVEKMNIETIQILADTLPKIVPYVLINHREELLPLIMCAIERHPNSNTRDSLTHTLFNLIKRPDLQQRRIIMDACVNLAKNIGEMRTESELLPQCWEQINHTYEERRLLVAQSCGELGGFVRPEIRESLILSIVQQLIEDSATVVREAAAHNLAMLIPLFPDMDKYFKLVCDTSGAVVETSLKELVPAVIKWGNKLDHILRVLLSHILVSAQRCPPLSGVEDSVDSHFRALGERERWTIDVLLRMLIELLPMVHHKIIVTCPFAGSPKPLSSTSVLEELEFSSALLKLYAGGNSEWPAFDWLHMDCLPGLIDLSCLLPPKEDKLRNRITEFLVSTSDLFGYCYVDHIMLPIFSTATGEVADLTHFPSAMQFRIKGMRPKSSVAEKLALSCTLPLLLAGLLGASSRQEQLAECLRKLLVQNVEQETSGGAYHIVDLLNAVRFLCTFEQHQGIIFNILWEMVVSSNVALKMDAAALLKVVVPYVDVKIVTSNALPALVTLGSDPNLNVKYSSIDAFGAVAQHFKTDVIVDKIRVQMDAFLEDGSQEATLAVLRALVVAVPHTTDKLRDYLLSKIFQLSSSTTNGSSLSRRRERADAFCEAIRALDATDLPPNSVKEFLIPAIQNLLKDTEALDPVHKEAMEIIVKERSGGSFDAFSKVMGAHLGLASSVTSLFGDSGLLGKKEITEVPIPPSEPQPSAEDTRFRRIMRGSFSDMIRSKGKNPDDSPRKQ